MCPNSVDIGLASERICRDRRQKKIVSEILTFVYVYSFPSPFLSVGRNITQRRVDRWAHHTPAGRIQDILLAAAELYIGGYSALVVYTQIKSAGAVPVVS